MSIKNAIKEWEESLDYFNRIKTAGEVLDWNFSNADLKKVATTLLKAQLMCQDVERGLYSKGLFNDKSMLNPQRLGYHELLYNQLDEKFKKIKKFKEELGFLDSDKKKLLNDYYKGCCKLIKYTKDILKEIKEHTDILIELEQLLMEQMDCINSIKSYEFENLSFAQQSDVKNESMGHVLQLIKSDDIKIH